MPQNGPGKAAPRPIAKQFLGFGHDTAPPRVRPTKPPHRGDGRPPQAGKEAAWYRYRGDARPISRAGRPRGAADPTGSGRDSGVRQRRALSRDPAVRGARRGRPRPGAARGEGLLGPHLRGQPARRAGLGRRGGRAGGRGCWKRRRRGWPKRRRTRPPRRPGRTGEDAGQGPMASPTPPLAPIRSSAWKGLPRNFARGVCCELRAEGSRKSVA